MYQSYGSKGRTIALKSDTMEEYVKGMAEDKVWVQGTPDTLFGQQLDTVHHGAPSHTNAHHLTLDTPPSSNNNSPLNTTVHHLKLSQVTIGCTQSQRCSMFALLWSTTDTIPLICLGTHPISAFICIKRLRQRITMHCSQTRPATSVLRLRMRMMKQTASGTVHLPPPPLCCTLTHGQMVLIPLY